MPVFSDGGADELRNVFDKIGGHLKQATTKHEEEEERTRRKIEKTRWKGRQRVKELSSSKDLLSLLKASKH